MNIALVPAGGSGSRFGAAKAKQFLELAGVPIIIRTLRHLCACPDISAVIVALPESDQLQFQELLTEFPLPKPCQSVIGGRERQDSVFAALQAAPVETQYFVVHDAVRPFISAHLISTTLVAAREDRAAIVGHPVTDTIKLVENGVAISTPPRNTLFAVQTPQTFEAALLRQAHDQASREGWRATDDAMLVEHLGVPVRIVPGPLDNLKITHPRDLELAEFVLKQQERMKNEE
ncbi:MAG: 2-C-methyl-D-erythritol 4-phosphate cytidylyltransferase [Acidobacteria bacterium]|nr:2-C-methyl-D-erythritol 4-phosphate cytidylyltransferase [Acidobacteriota bacterium]